MPLPPRAQQSARLTLAALAAWSVHCETVLRTGLHRLHKFYAVFGVGMAGKAGVADIACGLWRGMIDHRRSKIIRITIPLRLAKW